MKKEIVKDLNKFLDVHSEYLYKSYALSIRAHELGFNGFYKFFQIEAADAIVHTRRIMNYMQTSNVSYTLQNVKMNYNYEAKTIQELVEALIKIKTNFLNLTNILSSNAHALQDHLTVRFYEWFLKDFYEEIDYENDILDWIKMSNGNLFGVDKKVGEAAEPNTPVVIDPFGDN
ncbi:ferritin-like domain-containing protein [Spiroplasma endosymbiont of Amphibalanus improvisus]|uniref:ferritin-like domain-containing protein n=1 Tax=Spiroplasma endosymbiont of Amphibalanus improvisus TaxID=3066327 RepID=UPI00313E1726